jgi:hypothetical protein
MHYPGIKMKWGNLNDLIVILITSTILSLKILLTVSIIKELHWWFGDNTLR